MDQHRLEASLIVWHACGLDASDLIALARWRVTHDPTRAESTPEFFRLEFVRGLVRDGRLSEGAA